MRAEDTIQTDAVAVLRQHVAPGVCWYSIPNEGKRTPRNGALMKRLGRRAGAADLIALVHGRSYAFEFKTEDGRQSPEQKNFQREFVAAGGEYYIVRSLDEALDFFSRLGIIRGVQN